MRARNVIVVLGLVFFFTPVGLRAVGVTAHPFENRPLAAFPELSQGWGVFDQTTRFFVDRMPLREQAVHANTSISLHVFHTTPGYGRATATALPFENLRRGSKPAVSGAAGATGATGKAAAPPPAAGIPAQGQPGITILPGKDGWLFLEEELSRACSLFVARSTAMHRWERFAEIIRASGRRVVVVVAPDKTTMYPELLPKRYPESACGPAGHETNWNVIEDAHDPAILGMRGVLRSVPHAPPDETYFRKDTHWNTKGGVIAVRALLAHLKAGFTLPESEIVKARGTYTGDLTQLMGAPEKDRSPAWAVVRPGLGPVAEATQTLPGGGKARVLTRPAGGPPLLSGRTLLVDDSFGEAMRDALGAYTQSLSIVPWYGTPAASLTASIDRADTVILETVERDLNYKASDNAIVTPSFLKALRDDLTQRRPR